MRTNSDIRGFRKVVRDYYKKHGRYHLPWRKTSDPYRILVSETMLQQTQVERVVPKYESFLKKFPTVRALARAPLSEVLREWQGLGYNRRAKMLHETARVVATTYRGVVPRQTKKLLLLPGIGPYTASAVRVFAFNEPETLIETNVRSVFIHHFFRRRVSVSDARILPLVEKTVDADEPRVWYSALMDYGSYLKATLPNPSRRSAHHAVQKAFKGSDREIRGAILKRLSQGSASSRTLLRLPFSARRVGSQIKNLLSEGLISKRQGKYSLG